MCVQFSTVLKRHEIRFRLFWAPWPGFVERLNLFSLNSALRTKHSLPLCSSVLQCYKVEWVNLPLFMWWMIRLRHFLIYEAGLVIVRVKWKITHAENPHSVTREHCNFCLKGPLILCLLRQTLVLNHERECRVVFGGGFVLFWFFLNFFFIY